MLEHFLFGLNIRKVDYAGYVQLHLSIAEALIDPEDWDAEEVRETVDLGYIRQNGMNQTVDPHRLSRFFV